MLTRLEIQRFKNIRDLAVDLGPFTCIAGPNAVGKSNLFDAIAFLSKLATETLMDAALSVRDADRENGELEDLFWTDGSERSESLRLAAEMLVDPVVRDDFGRTARATSTFLRYEVELGLEGAKPGSTLGRIVLRAERLTYITEGEASKRLRFPHSPSKFRRNAVSNARRARTGYISTERAADGKTEILVHQDGGSRGKPERAYAASAPKTVVSTSNTSSTPTILAAKREMERWRILALEPSAMRRSDRFHDDPHVSTKGGHMAATLYRLGGSGAGDEARRDAAYARVASRLSALVPIHGVDVVRDDVRQLLTLQLSENNGTLLPARSASDGTLRFLALSIIHEDEEADGLICMEEPENGIHPAKIPSMVNLLKDLAVDPADRVSTDNPMRQVLVATHSPLFVQMMEKSDLLAAFPTTCAGPSGRTTTTLTLLPMGGTWRAQPSHGRKAQTITEGALLAYLTHPPGAQISLSTYSGLA